MTQISAGAPAPFAGDAAIRVSPLSAREHGPIMIEPLEHGASLAAWCAANRSRLDAAVCASGAVLLRGFAVVSIADFEAAARATWGDLFSEYGDLPRDRAGEDVYESTPYPRDAMILFHNESAHHPAWPMRINFHCVVPAARGGCTPILDTRVVMRELDPSVVAAFRAKGLTYLRNFSAGIEPSWQKFFHTSDRAAVEAACRAGGYKYDWRADGGLRLRKRTLGVAKHPVTHADVFFNQVQHHHVACLDAETRDGLRELFAEEDLPRHVSYGDGSPIPDETMAHIGAVYERECLRFAWQAGDVLMLDNMLTAHARDPFEGERRIVVAMARMIGAHELPQ